MIERALIISTLHNDYWLLRLEPQHPRRRRTLNDAYISQINVYSQERELKCRPVLAIAVRAPYGDAVFPEESDDIPVRRNAFVRMRITILQESQALFRVIHMSPHSNFNYLSTLII
jgi:hypothetical protein